MPINPLAGLNPSTSVVFLLEVAAYILITINYRFTAMKSVLIATLTIMITIFLMPPDVMNNPVNVIFIVIPGLMGILLLSRDTLTTTLYVFVDRHNLAFACNTLRMILFMFLGRESKIALFVPCLLTIFVGVYLWKKRPQSRKLLAWMNRTKTPFFLLPLGIIGIMRGLLSISVLGNVWALYFGQSMSVLAIMSSVLVQHACNLSEKATHNEIMKTELHLMSSQIIWMQEYIQQFDENRETVSRLQHDIRYHREVIAGLLQTKDYDKAMVYVNQLDHILLAATPMQYCKNQSVNAVLSIYIGRALEQGIQVEHRFQIPAKLLMDDVELSSVYANILENAIFACSQLPATSKRTISAYTEYKNGQLKLSVKNTCVPGVHFDSQDMPISNRPGRGIGTKNIRYIVEKHRGLVKFSEHNGLFTTNVLFFDLALEEDS